MFLSLFQKLVDTVESKGASADVTRRSLVLGSADLKTGRYVKSFTESNIKLLIESSGSQSGFAALGRHVDYTFNGYTDSAVREGDEIVDSHENVYRVDSVEPFRIGDIHVYNRLVLRPAGIGEGGAGAGEYWILVIMSDEGCSTEPEGVQYVPEGQGITVTLSLNVGFNFEGWTLNGEYEHKDFSIFVPPQLLGSVHVLTATTLRHSQLPIFPKPAMGWIESLVQGSALKVIDEFPVESQTAVLATSKCVVTPTLNYSEGLEVDNT